MFGALYNYIYGLVYPPPPPLNAGYGFRWQAGQGVPNQLSVFDQKNAAPGLYITFLSLTLDDSVEPFGRGLGGVGTVYPAPAAASAPVANLVAQVRQNPPPNRDEAAQWARATAARLADVSAFLSYTARCLDFIDQTAAGRQLFTNLAANNRTVFISPAGGLGNQTTTNERIATNDIVRAVIDMSKLQATPRAELDGMVQQRYAALVGAQARYNRLAADMNSTPLYSLFVQEANFSPNFLNANFRFRSQRLTGQNLMNWLSPGGFGAFDTFVKTDGTVAQGVLVRQFFMLALIFALYTVAPNGAGAGSGLRFNVRNDGDNVLGSASFRPPAIGLAHELVHAMHYGAGSALGFDIGGFTTTMAELMFAGIVPFNNVPISENAIRMQWNSVAAPDPSNVWAVPVRRTIYEPPVPPETVASMRRSMHCV